MRVSSSQSLIAILWLTTPFLFGQVGFRALHLSGNVLMEDGSAPPEPVRVFLVCSEGKGRPLGYTDQAGHFNFSGGPGPDLEDATTSRPTEGVGGARGEDRSHVNLSECLLRANLAGYSSSTIRLGRRSVFENPEVGTLILYAKSGSSDRTVDIDRPVVPKKAQQAHDKALKELARRKPNLGKVSRELEKALEIFPRFASAWNLLGEVSLRQDDRAGARAAFEKSISSDAHFVPPYLTLALMELKENRPAEAVELAERAIQIVPKLAEAHFYRGIGNATLGNLSEAESSLLVVIESHDASRFPRAHYVLGQILASRGDLAGAVRHYQSFLEIEPDSRVAEAVRKQLSQWESQGVVP